MSSYTLERSGKVRVTAVARSNAAAVRDRGITVESAKYGAFSFDVGSGHLRSSEHASGLSFVVRPVLS